MHIEHDGDGQPVVTRYDHGDLVTLRQDEAGPFGIGRRGDWGAVERVDRFGILTVLLAGYSRPRTSPIPRLTGLSPASVLPCDRHGRPLRLRRIPPLRPRRAAAPAAGVGRRVGPLLLALAGGAGAVALLALR